MMKEKKIVYSSIDMNGQGELFIFPGKFTLKDQNKFMPLVLPTKIERKADLALA